MTTPDAMTSDDHPGHDGGRRRLPGWLVPAGLALAMVGLVGGLLLGKGMAAEGAERVTDPVSLGFVRDMGVHHSNAVLMTEIVHRRSADPDLNYLAFDILSTQQGQIGIMSGWLELWQQSRSGTDEQMAWMGHTGPMPGMASQDQIAELNTLPVADMEEQFLRLMIRHHRGAVPMANAAAAGATSPEVAVFAEKMSAGQQSEVDLMQSLLAERGLAPEPEDATGGHGTAGSHQGMSSASVAEPIAPHPGH